MLPKLAAQKKLFGDENPIVASFKRSMSPSQAPPPEEWTKMKFPYQTSDELPAPIPTADEIEKARGTADDLTAYRGPAAFYYVYRVHSVYAVKLASDPIILQEAENLLFLKQHSKIRVPKVYAVFSHQGGDPYGLLEDGEYTERSELPTYNYLVMDFVSGRNSQSEEDWNTLSRNAKVNLCRRIGQQLSLLQEVSAPSPYYGRINYQGFFPGYPYFSASGQGFLGPYNSHKDFIQTIYTTGEWRCAVQAGEDYLPFSKLFLESFKRCMDKALGQEPRLTHTNLRLQNVIAQPKEDEPEDFDVVIIDWATMAWMPTYVQAATIQRNCPRKLDQHMYAWELSQAIKPFPHDAACYFNMAPPAMLIMHA